MAHFLTLFLPLFLSSLLLTPEWLLPVAVGIWGAETRGAFSIGPGGLWLRFQKADAMEGSERRMEEERAVSKAGSSLGLSTVGTTALS